ncbi:hypothetical protein MYU51_010461 [Penicillium brevicompactum]
MPPRNSTKSKIQGQPILPVSTKDKIAGVWPSILFQILKKHTLPNVAMIGCFRYGIDLRTTVVILLNASDEQKECVDFNLEEIRKLLDRHGLQHVAVAVENGIVSLGNGEAHSIGDLDHQILRDPAAIIGQSLAHKSNKNAAGTLGGFVELKIQGSWVTMALTCSHVVCSEDLSQEMVDYWKRRSMEPRGGKSADEVLLRWNDYGVSPNDENRFMLEIAHPAPAALTKAKKSMAAELEVLMAMDNLQDLLDKDERGEGDFIPRGERQTLKRGKYLFEHLKKCKEFIAKDGGDFGIVWAASGLNAEHKSTRGFEWVDRNGTHIEKLTLKSSIDWALIIPPDYRIPKVPTPYPRYHDISRRSLFPQDLGGTEVCMEGQRNQFSTGFIHSLVTASNFEAFESHLKVDLVKDVRTNLDWVVTGKVRIDDKGRKTWAPFSQGGDSGSLVYTNTDPQNRVLVGMVRAGTTPVPWWTYVIPIEFIYQDIISRTGAEAIRLRV